MKLTRKSVLLMAMVTCVSGFSMTQVMAADTRASAQTVKQEAQDLAEALKGYAVDQKQDAIKAVKVSLEILDAKIDDIETHVANGWDTMDQSTRKHLNSSLKALRKQRIQLAEWYGSLKNSSAASWEHTKEGFSGAYASLKRSWQNIEKEFEEKR